MTGLRIPPEAGPEERAAEFTDEAATPRAGGAATAQADAERAETGQARTGQAETRPTETGLADPRAPASPGPGLDGESERPPVPDGTRARFGAAGWLRWGWRQLTSMRTALILLFLLAVGSVPGSLLPQDGSNPAAVAQYYAAHPALAPILARLSLFNVFGAPWFAAIYLLLFLSLVGCVLPRTVRMALSARQPPPRAPRHLDRLPLSVSYRTALAPEQALESAAGLLSGRRFRVRAESGWISAEKGYLREAGNLLFHIALLAVLVSIGLGGLYGYKANRLLVAGTTFSNTVTALDEFHPGRLVSPGDLQPFSLTLDRFSAAYVTSGALLGQPSSFDAALTYTAAPGGPAHHYTLAVNHPLSVDGVRVFLIGHGYAPEFRVTDGTGHVVFDGAVPFIPVETSGLTSQGAIKVPDANPQQLGFVGVFLPTTVDVGGRLVSQFPAPLRPRVSLISYAGNLGMNTGTPQSVYSLNTAGLHQLAIAPRPLAAGQSMKLPGGLGTVTYLGYRQWISLAITYDPGQLPALLSGIAVLGGLLLSFLVRRRRVFVRARAGAEGETVVDVGGLSRSDAAGGFEDEFSRLAAEISGLVVPATQPPPAQPPPAQPAPPRPGRLAGALGNQDPSERE
ncbi:MAG TPA: cytochrome c biogenesis protein ResB [Streptosporangiaceae bacterium]|nr:cytochrome c biogenesis protein ResB [Streptosporangiaceae bacterium]